MNEGLSTENIPTPHCYYVDESGSGVIFDSKGRVLLGTGKVPEHFSLGMVELDNHEALQAELAQLRADLLADPYFKGVPSMQPQAQKSAIMFHAKDDLPEIRREVFKVLLRHEFNFYGVVRTMRAVHRVVAIRNRRDPTYRYNPTELYDSAVRRLFHKKLHTQPAYQVIFASRGKARTRYLREHLLTAQRQSKKAAKSFPHAKLEVLAAPSRDHVGLQVADYCLWAVQRLFEKDEDRYLDLIWPRVALLVDVDDISEKPYGTYHSRKLPPLDATKIKSRKVEELGP